MTVKKPLEIDILTQELQNDSPHWLSPEGQAAAKRPEVHARLRAEWLEKQVTESVKSFKKFIRKKEK